MDRRLSTDLARESDRIAFDWASVIRWRVHSIQVFIIEALSWVERPLSATELRSLCGGKATLDAISFHLNQLAKLAIVDRVASLKVRKSQGSKQETFFFFANDSSWIGTVSRYADQDDHLLQWLSE